MDLIFFFWGAGGDGTVDWGLLVLVVVGVENAMRIVC